MLAAVFPNEAKNHAALRLQAMRQSGNYFQFHWQSVGLQKRSHPLSIGHGKNLILFSVNQQNRAMHVFLLRIGWGEGGRRPDEVRLGSGDGRGEGRFLPPSAAYLNQ